MFRLFLTGSALGVCLLGSSSFALAHHATAAEFDSNKPISFTGTVQSVDWLNPHIYVNIETKDAQGKPVVYSVEGGPPNSLYRNGWRKDTLRIGEVVTVTGNRAKKDESNRVGNASLVTQDGKRVLNGRAERAEQ